MPFTVIIDPSALKDLKGIRVFDRRCIVQAIDDQLIHEATVATRNRKILPDLVPPFFCRPPVWQLRIGDFRVFYDVDEDVVHVRAIRPKLPHQTREQML
jgi:mRNA-degrading endonuclease RelE of RelBE toxin-antitoxin system